MQNIQTYLSQKILVLDGAYGTAIQNLKLVEDDFRGSQFKNCELPQQGNNDLLNITQPEAIIKIHSSYLQAGADILCTNTFNSNRIAMEDYGMQDKIAELNVQSVINAKQAIAAMQDDKPRWIAGCVGPTNKTASISPSVENPEYRGITFNELVTCYDEQVTSLVTAGADIILIETVFDTLNAKAALFACHQVMKQQNKQVPIMVSGTITDNSGRTLSGQTVEAFAASITHMPLLSIGFNCALGADQLLPHIKSLSQFTDNATSCHPNAGLPNTFGEYDQTPSQMAELIAPYIDQKLVNIIGGCCGTTPEHIQAVADKATAASAIRKFKC